MRIRIEVEDRGVINSTEHYQSDECVELTYMSRQDLIKDLLELSTEKLLDGMFPDSLYNLS